MKKVVYVFLLLGMANLVSALPVNDVLPLKRVMIYNSGVAYYEHEKTLSGNALIEMSFNKHQINDILKSITIIDPKADEISIDYDCIGNVYNVLDGLSIDPSKSYNLAEFLNQQKGAEIEIQTAQKIKGKILNVSISESSNSLKKDFISIFSDGKILSVNFEDMKSFYFTDAKLNKDLETALNTLAYSNNIFKKIFLNIKSKNSRHVKLGYVMSTPIWKMTYRMYFDDENSIFQAWAIVDNATNFDWKDVQLTLMTGKPVSFVQHLYEPYFALRKEVDLQDKKENIEYEEESYSLQKTSVHEKMKNFKVSEDLINNDLYSTENVFKAQAKEGAAEQFSFIIPKPITIFSQKSVSIPLVSIKFPSEKFSLFSNMPIMNEVNPELTINITNKSLMKLPKGVVTLYDDKGYMGDAMMDYLGVNQKSLLSFGEDKNVVGTKKQNSSQKIVLVKIQNGVVEQKNEFIYETVYNIKNKDTKSKNIVIEHPCRQNSTISSDMEPYDKSDFLYKYKFQIQADKEYKFIVTEKIPLSNSYKILNLDDVNFSYFITNSEIPENIKKIFEEIYNKKLEIKDMQNNLNLLIDQRKELFNSQQRARENLVAIGSHSANSKEFLEKILADEKKINELSEEIKVFKTDVDKKKREFEKYVENIKI